MYDAFPSINQRAHPLRTMFPLTAHSCNHLGTIRRTVIFSTRVNRVTIYNYDTLLSAASKYLISNFNRDHRDLIGQPSNARSTSVLDELISQVHGLK